MSRVYKPVRVEVTGSHGCGHGFDGCDMSHVTHTTPSPSTTTFTIHHHHHPHHPHHHHHLPLRHATKQRHDGKRAMERTMTKAGERLSTVCFLIFSTRRGGACPLIV